MLRAAVLIPVLRRPDHVAPVLASLSASQRDVRLHALFVATPDDFGEIGALKAVGATYLVATWDAGPGDYARKMNYGYAWAVEQGFDWILLGADDLVFHPGWAEAATHEHNRSGACVIGTNDLGNPEVMAGRHSTHSLVHRDYLACGTIDEDGKILHEGYAHNWVDNEFVGTAKARGTFSSARDSHVEHLHWAWGKADMDDIYKIGGDSFHVDRKLYEHRRRLWE